MVILRVTIQGRGLSFPAFAEEITRIVREMTKELEQPEDGAVLVVAEEGKGRGEMTVEWPVALRVEHDTLGAWLHSICREYLLRFSLDEVLEEGPPLFPVAKFDFRTQELRMINHGEPKRPPPRAAIRDLVLDLIPPPMRADQLVGVGIMLKSLSPRYRDIYLSYTQRGCERTGLSLERIAEVWAQLPLSAREEHSWLELKRTGSRWPASP